MGFLAYVLRKPLQTYLETRRENLKTELDKARTKQAEAEKRLAEYTHKLSHLEDEVERIVRSFKDQGEADRARLMQIMRNAGIARNVFISLLPGWVDPVAEQDHMIYGKRANAGVSFDHYALFSNKIDIEGW